MEDFEMFSLAGVSSWVAPFWLVEGFEAEKISKSSWIKTVRTSMDINALCPLSKDFPVVKILTSKRFRTIMVVTNRNKIRQRA